MHPGPPLLSSLQNAPPEDRFAKSKRSLDVGDGEKVCDPAVASDSFSARLVLGFTASI
jgi:hypothetical protein